MVVELYCEECSPVQKLCHCDLNNLLSSVPDADGVPPIEIHQRMLAVYVACVYMSTMSRWVNKCKDGEAGTSDSWDNPRPGRPVTATGNPLKE